MVPTNAQKPPPDFRLLGPVTVVVDGAPAPIGGPRQVAVLARLMMSPHQAVTMDQLVASVWDGDEPAQPQVTLRSYISNLRRVIEPDRKRRASESCLLSTPSGYQLAVDPECIDWVRFERKVEKARSQLATGDSEGTIESIRRTLKLWAGVPCSGLPESEVLVAHRGRLIDLRDTAIELLFEAQLAIGQQGAVAGQVEAAIAESPLRERFTELGMLALYRASRQAEALALGQRLRSRLRNELGVDPGPAIEAIELKILNHDPALDLPADGPGLLSADQPPTTPPEMPVRTRSAAHQRWRSVGTGAGGEQSMASTSGWASSQSSGPSSRSSSRSDLLAAAEAVSSDGLVGSGHQRRDTDSSVSPSGLPVPAEGFEAEAEVDSGAGRGGSANMATSQVSALTPVSPPRHPDAIDIEVTALHQRPGPTQEHREWGGEGSGSRPGGRDLGADVRQGAFADLAGGRTESWDEVGFVDGESATPGPWLPRLRLDAVGLVGRDAELSTVSALRATLQAGRSVSLALTGDHGIGKSALAQSIVDAVATPSTSGVVWGVGGASQADYWIWVQVVLGLLDLLDDALIADMPDLAPLAALGPAVAAAIGSQPTEPDRESEYPTNEIGVALTRLVDRVADQGQVIVVFEDLQWADTRSLALLRTVASACPRRPVAFVLTWRPSLDETSAGSLRALSRLPGLLRLDLDGISADDIHRLGQRAGLAITQGEALHLHRLCAGNPMLARELMADGAGDGDVANGSTMLSTARHSPALNDIVVGQIENMHPQARFVLSAAAVHSAPFTAGDVADLLAVADQVDGPERAAGVKSAAKSQAGEVIRLAVAGGVLVEVDSTGERHRFRQPVVAEVLAAGLASTVRASMHQVIGRRLLGLDRLDPAVAHHLIQSSAPMDRLVGARHALALVAADPAALPIELVDHYVLYGIRACDDLSGRQDAAAERRLFKTDLAAHSSHRAWLDERPDAWWRDGVDALNRSIDLMPPTSGRGGVRSRAADREARDGNQDQSPSPVSAIGRLEWAVMNLVGSPIGFVGPTRTADRHHHRQADLELLSSAAEQLPTNSPYRWAAQIHLMALKAKEIAAAADPSRSDRARQTQRMKEVTKTLASARKRVAADDLPLVQVAALRRFRDSIGPDEQLVVFDEISNLGTETADRPVSDVGLEALANLELGRSHRAESDLRRALDSARQAGNRLNAIEARLLLARHLIWVGALDDAHLHNDRARNEWLGLGLPEPLGLRSQRWVIDRQRRPDDNHPVPIPMETSAVATLPEPLLAVWSAIAGDKRRTDEWIDAVIDSFCAAQLGLCDLAMLAMAVKLAEHEKGALFVFEPLLAYGHRLVATSDGAMLFGPASLHASLAAEVIGKPIKANRLRGAAVAEIERTGGDGSRLLRCLVGTDG